jgi:hypothetical protein
MNIGIVSGVIFLINFICGYWRVQTKKYSILWLMAVHVPIPFVILLRIFCGIGWELMTFPIFIGTYFAGQFLGGKLCGYLRKA